MKRSSRWKFNGGTAAGLILSALVLAAGSHRPQALYAQGGARISGAAISKVARDTRKLTVTAQAPTGSSSATGTIAFIHNSPAGLSRFRGNVSCLSVNGGVVQVSGTIEKGETATGALLDGKAYAITINASGSPQTFSLPTVGDAGAVGACSGGSSQTVAVTEDGFKLN
jgi:surface antigen